MKDPTLYVPSHAGIWTNRKFLRLTRRLATSELVVFACLHSLWQGVLTQRPEGVLTGWDEVDIALAARWPGEPRPFLDALLAEGWLTQDDGGALVVHEWDEYGGAGATLRSAAARRKRDQRERERQRSTGRDTGAVSQGHGVTPGACHAEVTPERIGNGSGSGTDRERERAPSDRTAPPDSRSPAQEQPIPEPPDVSARVAVVQAIERAKETGDVGGVLAAVTASVRPLRARTVVGMAEAEARPKSPEELVRLPAVKAAEPRWPGFDGQNGRPTFLDVVREKWPRYVDASERYGNAQALRSLLMWIAQDYPRIKGSYERDVEKGAPGTVARNPKAIEADRARERARVEAERAARASEGTPEAAAGMAQLRAAVRPRAGPAGGTKGSGGEPRQEAAE